MAKLRLDGEASGAVRAVKQLNKELGKSDEELDAITKRARGAEGAAKRLAEKADPQRKYNREMADLAKHVKAGRLELTDAEKVAVRYGRTLDRATQAGNGAFGGTMQSNIGSVIGQIAAVAGSVASLQQALESLKQERLQAAGSFSAASPGLAQLLQLAVTADDPRAAKKELDREARQFFASGVGKTLDEAAGTNFDLRSAELDKAERKFAGDLAARGIIQDIGGAAKASSGLQSALGRGETGSFREIVSKALAASEIAPAFAQEIVQASSKGGDEAKRLGLAKADEFLLAGTAVAGKPSGSASVGGTQIEAFLAGLEKTGAGAKFRGQTGLQIVEDLAARGLDRAGLAKFVGNDKEAIGGASTLINNVDLLRTQFGKVDAANARDLGGLAIRLSDEDLTQSASLRRRQAANRRLLQQENEANAANLVDTILDQRTTQERRVAPGMITEWSAGFNQMSLGVARFLKTNEAILDTVLDDGGVGIDRQTREQANALLGRQVEALERNNQLLEQQAASGPQE